MKYSDSRSNVVARITMVFDGMQKPKAVKCYCTRAFLRFVDLLSVGRHIACLQVMYNL